MKKKLMFLLLLIIIPFNVGASEKVKFLKCVDGDTIKVKIDSQDYTVRFLAIDTPETKHPKKIVEPFGKEASNYTCNKVKKAKELVLEYDKNSTNEDKYGRKLAWVFVDGELLQKQLVAKGYAKVAYLYGNYKYTGSLKQAEKEAMANKVGIWSNKITTKADYQSEYYDVLLDKIFKYFKKKLKSMI